MRSLLLVLEYDGTDFAGFQTQPARRTVQGDLESAIERVTGERARIKAAGRTDAGVHATGQVASLTTESCLDVDTLSRALNACLPPDVVVKLVREVPEGFHARYSALSRAYVYRVWTAKSRTPLGRRYSHHWPRPLDLRAIQAAAATLVGTHDFASFAGSADPSRAEARSTIRTVRRLETRQQGSLVEIGVEANAFLPRMVRNLVGTLLLVGSGKLRVGEVSDILDARSRALAGPTAPAEGLYLVAVRYPCAALGEPGDLTKVLGGTRVWPMMDLPDAVARHPSEGQWRQDDTLTTQGARDEDLRR